MHIFDDRFMGWLRFKKNEKKLLCRIIGTDVWNRLLFIYQLKISHSNLLKLDLKEVSESICILEKKLSDKFAIFINILLSCGTRGASRAAATSKMELFVIIVNDFQPLTFIAKCSILDVAAVLDPPLEKIAVRRCFFVTHFRRWCMAFRHLFPFIWCCCSSCFSEHFKIDILPSRSWFPTRKQKAKSSERTLAECILEEKKTIVGFQV